MADNIQIPFWRTSASEAQKAKILQGYNGGLKLIYELPLDQELTRDHWSEIGQLFKLGDPKQGTRPFGDKVIVNLFPDYQRRLWIYPPISNKCPGFTLSGQVYVPLMGYMPEGASTMTTFETLRPVSPGGTANAVATM